MSARSRNSFRRSHDVSAIARTLANESSDGSGATKAERILTTLVAAANHCANAGRIDVSRTTVPKRWKKALREEWTKLTGLNVMQPHRPKYSEAETVRLLAHLDFAHPRLRLILNLTAGYRVLQIAQRATRRSISEGGVFGRRLTFFDAKRMKDVVIDLTPRQQKALEHAWAEGGLLHELEAAYESGEIADYALVPAGKLRDGVAQLRYAARPSAKTDLLKYLHELEDVAGVKRVEKRGFHGLRRTIAKLVARQTGDAELRDLAQGWKPGSGTREMIYDVAEEDEERLGLAAEARARAIEAVAPGTPAERAAAFRIAMRSLAERIDAAAVGDDRTARAYAPVLRLLADVLVTFEQVERELVDLPSQTAGTPRDGAIAAHAALCDEVRAEVARRGITAKQAAALMGLKSSSDMSLIMQGKSRGYIKLERLQSLVAALKAAPET